MKLQVTRREFIENKKVLEAITKESQTFVDVCVHFLKEKFSISTINDSIREKLRNFHNSIRTKYQRHYRMIDRFLSIEREWLGAFLIDEEYVLEYCEKSYMPTRPVNGNNNVFFTSCFNSVKIK